MTHMKKLFLLGFMTAVIAMMPGRSAWSSAGCPTYNVFEGVVGNIPWNEMQPIIYMGASLMGDPSDKPSIAASSPFCSCPDSAGIPHPGMVASMWDPAKLIEFEHIPGCMSALGTSPGMFNRIFVGHMGDDIGNGNGTNDRTMLHYHAYAFPIVKILQLFVGKRCGDEYTDFDVVHISEVDPTWNDDTLAFFSNPEATLLSSPLAMIACIPEAAVVNVGGEPIDRLFWCSGSWGTIYPLSGNVAGGKSAEVLTKSSLMIHKWLGVWHRRGFMQRTAGDDVLCKAKYDPLLKKSMYKISLMFPRPEEAAHYIGKAEMWWGSTKRIPATGEDPLYLIFRWSDCCLELL